VADAGEGVGYETFCFGILFFTVLLIKNKNGSLHALNVKYQFSVGIRFPQTSCRYWKPTPFSLSGLRQKCWIAPVFCI
jgi:hypothetical protein